MSNIAFIRLAGFATGFTNDYTHLRRPFLNSIWSACTFNLGPRTCCLGHRDHGNLAFGWCAITALGNYDYTKGGHLILWDCKLILEFPPGTTILIPSAAIFHSNIPIGPGEPRLSPEERSKERAEQRARWTEGAGLFSTMDKLKSFT
ncbi:hypothetical protein C8F04DRAFT_1210516 [Mycena alexandri]|uniref:Uncharacterized protein n=1 Tax=Mycena alexandri TaxID=1745969 RepID=A0AAD6SW74_9AGAR|nr:hypothetical protein C8F04DRAFT_1210516 [Mycena alexandri]